MSGLARRAPPAALAALTALAALITALAVLDAAASPSSATAAPVATPDCPPGEPIQWMADACMAALQTDDEIAASDCIERQRRLRFRDACAAKLHFKRQLCETLAGVGAGSVDRVARCLADPRFHGRSVGANDAVAPSLPTLRPVDEAAAQPDFLAFRSRLQAAVAHRDAGALLAAVHPHIKNSFGGDDGIAAFRERWRPDDPRSPVWDKLAEVLSLGGRFDAGGRFVAPYVFSAWPEGVDAFEHVAVLGRGVRVRAAPHEEAEPLARLDHALVRLQPEQPDGDWTAVRLPDGRGGFVHRSLVRSPVDYRAAFEKSDGPWRMTLFLAGD